MLSGVMGGVILAGPVCAADWDRQLAETLDPRLAAIRRDIEAAGQRLESLPRIPVDDQGGSGGFALLHSERVPDPARPSTITVRWPRESRIDEIALVPARRYDARGLDPQFGLPDAFTVDLMDAHGNIVARVADEKQVCIHPVRTGHPFVYRLDQPVLASALVVRAMALGPSSDGDAEYAHAWSEVFAFEGERNVAAGADVTGAGGSPPAAPWQWRADYLTDGQTPLGLPEVPSPGHRNVGWISEGRGDPNQAVSLLLDFKQSVSPNLVRLMPAGRPSNDLPSGFGFPRRISVEMFDDSADGSWRDLASLDLRNPGHNPVDIALQPARGSRMRVVATGLWKAFETYPAFFALSEIEVIENGRNLAAGIPVRSPDDSPGIIAPGGRFWSLSSLSDGHGPDGRLVPVREWLGLLDESLKQAVLIHEGRHQSDAIIAGWRQTSLAVLGLLGIAGAIAVVALPVRYRARARREVELVRDRIAGDLHDEVGSNLGSIQMLADLAEARSGASDEMKRIQRIAAETVSAVRDIVWLLRPGGQHRIATVEHLRETTSIMLESLDWHFHADDPAWDTELSEERTRHLFLFFREALHNILRHSGATRVEVGIRCDHDHLMISIADNGSGIESARMERPATLSALRKRAAAMQAGFEVETTPGQGVRLALQVPRR
jgi:signal transduction histidine kinase